jgi:uncharacterized protein
LGSIEGGDLGALRKRNIMSTGWRPHEKGRQMKILVKTVIGAASLALISTTALSQETFVRMVAGPAGGSWYPFGAKIMEVLQRDVPGIRTSNGPGGGVGNVRAVDKGNAELGWTFGFTAYNGYNGKGKFKKPATNIRFFATLYPGILQTAVPAKSKIRSYRDLAKSNFSPGKLTFSGNVTVEKLLGLYGITYAMIKQNGGTIHRVGYKDSVALMKDGQVDAFVGLTTAPNASFIALDFSPGIRLLSVEPDIAGKFVKENPGFFATTIAAGTYKGITSPVPTIATATVLVINKNVSDDLAYKMMVAFWKNHDEIGKIHRNWQNVKLSTALQAAAIPVHPGAMKYYKEKGIAK